MTNMGAPCRERVQLSLNHREPDRVPFTWGEGFTPEMERKMVSWCSERGVSWEKLRFAADDILEIEPPYAGPRRVENRDIWGVQRKPVSYEGGIYYEYDVQPLAGASSIDVINNHPWPKPEWFDVEAIRGQLVSADDEKSYRLTCNVCGYPVEILAGMMGLEELLINLYEKPDIITAGLRKITDFFLAMMRKTIPKCKKQLDILYFADDLGTQHGSMISPDTYREIIKPFHRELFECGKSLAPDAKVMYHSDGSIVELLSDLIEAGLECLEPVQIEATGMEPEKLKRKFGSQISFHGAISVQQLLPLETAETVGRECVRLIDILGKGGGFIAAPTHAIQVDTPEENVIAMLLAVIGEKTYEEICEYAAQS